MKLAFVFPGQGSQSVGMMDALRRSSGGRARRSTRPPTRWARTCGRSVADGPAEQLNRTVEHAAGDADRRRRGLARVARGGRAAAGDRGRPQPGRIHGAGRRRCARVPRRGAAGALSRAGDAGSRAGGRRARWPRSWASTTTPCVAALRRGGAGRGGRGGQLQRPGPDRDRRPQRRRSSARSRPARRGAPSAACCCRCRRRSIRSLMQPAADRLAARLAERGDRARRGSRCCNNVDVATHRDPDAIRDALVRQAASPVRWVETVRAMAARGRHARRRVRPGQGAGRAWPSASPTAWPALRWRDIDGDRRGAGRSSERIGHERMLARDRSRWSPARRAASAAPSRWRSARRARPSSARRRRDDGAATIAACLAEAGIAGTGHGARRHRCGGGRRGARRDRAKKFGADHDPRQQRRHHPRQPAAADEGRGVGRGHRHQPASPSFRLSQGRAARHDEGAPRPHHQDRLGGRQQRQPGSGQLRGRQGRRCWASPSRWRRKSAAATSPSTAWRPASSTPT